MSVLESSIGVVDRARANDDEQSIITLTNDRRARLTMGLNGGHEGGRDGQLLQQTGRRNERTDLLDTSVDEGRGNRHGGRTEEEGKGSDDQRIEMG